MSLARSPIVLDTNILLDLFVFADPLAAPLREQLDAGALDWIATPPMREELDRVLAFFAAGARLVAPAPKAVVTCKDADDQKFIDLAVAHQAQLLSKDRAVLCMKKRLLPWGVRVGACVLAPSLNGDGAM